MLFLATQISDIFGQNEIICLLTCPCLSLGEESEEMEHLRKPSDPDPCTPDAAANGTAAPLVGAFILPGWL